MPWAWESIDFSQTPVLLKNVCAASYLGIIFSNGKLLASLNLYGNGEQILLSRRVATHVAM